MGYDVPREIKYGFIAIVKEALHNIVRHSDASKSEDSHAGAPSALSADRGG